MAYQITDMSKDEIHPGVFSYAGEVYKIDEDGNVYQWDQNAQLGGFFKKIGKVFKKAFKIVKKVAPYAALAYTGYGFATALSSGMSVGAAASSALTGPSSIIGKVAQGVSYLTGGGKAQPVVAAPVGSTAFWQGQPGSVADSGGGFVSAAGQVATSAANYAGVAADVAMKVIPTATTAVAAYYGYKTQQAQAQAQADLQASQQAAYQPQYGSNVVPFTGGWSGSPAGMMNAPIGSPENQGIPAYASPDSGFLQPTSEQTPAGVPDVTPTLEKYKTPIMIGIGVIGLLLATNSKGR